MPSTSSPKPKPSWPPPLKSTKNFDPRIRTKPRPCLIEQGLLIFLG